MPEVIFNGPEGRRGTVFPEQASRRADCRHFAPASATRRQYEQSHRLSDVPYVSGSRLFGVAVQFPRRWPQPGEFDNGIGELSDAASALDWLQALTSGAPVLDCRIQLRCLIGMQLLMRRPEISGFISVAPPANLYDFSFLAPCPASGLIVHGAADKIVPKKILSVWSNACRRKALRLIMTASKMPIIFSTPTWPRLKIGRAISRPAHFRDRLTGSPVSRPVLRIYLRHPQWGRTRRSFPARLSAGPDNDARPATQGFRLQRIARPAQHITILRRHAGALLQRFHQCRIVTTATTHDQARGRISGNFQPPRHRRRGEGGKCRRAIFGRQRRHRRRVEGQTVERFGRARSKKACDKAFASRLINAPASRQRTVGIISATGFCAYPVIDHRIAGAGVESADFVALAQQGNIGDPANIQNAERPGPAFRAAA